MKIKVDAGETQWIWSAKNAKDQVPNERCYFRKSFTMGDVEQGKVQITCDDQFDLYVNGRLVGSGTEWKKLKSFESSGSSWPARTRLPSPPRTPRRGSAGLVARVTVRQKGSTDVSHSTDASWRTSDHETVGWEKPGFDDAAWPTAKVLASSATLSHGVKVSRRRTARNRRLYRFAPEFRVERSAGSRRYRLIDLDGVQ